jgi:spore maturation protein CgeB
MKKIYIKKHDFGAGKWIYKGYESAWQTLGFEPIFYDELDQIDTKERYDLMAIDGTVNLQNLHIVEQAERCYLYVQPNRFPDPWGRHPNFSCLCPDEAIQKLNELDNVHQWCFGKVTDFHYKWKNVNYLPLAFDSINYKWTEDKEYQFDVCYIGGWANNGFNEKKQIIVNHFKEFRQSNLKCGFFVNRNIPHDVETKILSNSIVSLNIHDAYQRTLGLDTNERTFKSLGLCGLLVSDKVDEVQRIFPEVETASSTIGVREAVQRALDLSPADRENIKENNRTNIIDKHTYIIRASQMLELK